MQSQIRVWIWLLPQYLGKARTQLSKATFARKNVSNYVKVYTRTWDGRWDGKCFFFVYIILYIYINIFCIYNIVQLGSNVVVWTKALAMTKSQCSPLCSPMPTRRLFYDSSAVCKRSIVNTYIIHTRSGFQCLRKTTPTHRTRLAIN